MIKQSTHSNVEKKQSVLLFECLQLKEKIKFNHLVKDMSQGPVADSGFFRGEVRQLSKVLLFFIFFAENCMKMKKNWTPGGGRVPAPPLGSANEGGVCSNKLFCIRSGFSVPTTSGYPLQ